MKTEMYEKIEAQRDLAKYAHGTFAYKVSKYFEAAEGLETVGFETVPRKPCKQDLRYGHPIDVLMRKGKRYIGIEILNHCAGDRFQARELASKAKKNKCKMRAVVTKEYNLAFVTHCMLKGIEIFELVSDNGDGIELARIKL